MMNLRIKCSDVWFVVIVTLLLALPAAYEPHHFAKTLFTGALLQSFSISIVTAWLTRCHRVVRIVVFSVSFLLFSVESYTYVCFDSRFNPAILTLVLQTSKQEVGEFFSVYVSSVRSLLSVLLAALLYVLLYRMLFGLRERYFSVSGVFRHLVLLLTVVGLALPFIPLPVPLGRHSLGELYADISFVSENHADLNTIHALLGEVRVSQSPSAASAPVVVLVIGESFNKYHSSLYGYSLPTSPAMEQERDASRLVVFDAATTPTNGTAFAMRYLLTLKSCDDAHNDTSRCILVPHVFREAGYKVAYFDNQYTRSTGGELDYSCVFFLNPQRINEACFDFRNTHILPYDLDFVNRYAKDLLRMPKSLNIIHLMGQHFDASKRYPTQAVHFTASDIQRTDLTDSERRQVAEYDNAVHYNDMVLSRIVSIFRQSDAVVVYLSDHGEQIYEGSKHYFGRTFGSYRDKETLRSVYQVPMMVWCSDRFQQRHAEQYQALIMAASRPLCIDDMPYLLFDLAGIRFNHYHPERSIINAAYRPHQTVFD